MQKGLIFVLVGLFLGLIGCAPNPYFASETEYYPKEFGQTIALVKRAENSPGAQYCPEKIAKAQNLGRKGVETYWAWRTKEGLALLAQSRQLAEEAMLCEPSDATKKPVDSDRDGVYDEKDRCPNTPEGVKVDSAGCPVDTDGDGVYDDQDKCPGTPEGLKVDTAGCPLDSDGDGVYDYGDHCPGTPRGATVDNRGCWVLEGLYFDKEKWDIKPQSFPVLDEVVSILKKNPSLKVEVQGHTDNQGPMGYNQELSEERALVVMYYFISRGIERGRLSAKGFGSLKPADSNDTPEGRAKNRRVELRPIH